MAAAVSARADVVAQVEIPIQSTFTNACAVDGGDLNIALSGNAHALIHVSTDSAGGIHSDMHLNYQDVTGTGLETGNQYQASAVTHTSWSGDGTVREFTIVDQFGLTGQGMGNIFLIHETIHVTINAQGQVSANVDDTRAECK